MDNNEAQSDEFLALQSIYDDTVFTAVEEMGIRGGQFVANSQLSLPFQVTSKLPDDETPRTHQIEHLPPVMLNFKFPLDYPSDSPPHFTLSCKWLTREQLSMLCAQLDKIWEENKGEVVLFHWFQFLTDETLKFLGIKESVEVSVVPKNSRTKIAIHETSCELEKEDTLMKEEPTNFKTDDKPTMSYYYQRQYQRRQHQKHPKPNKRQDCAISDDFKKKFYARVGQDNSNYSKKVDDAVGQDNSDNSKKVDDAVGQDNSDNSKKVDDAVSGCSKRSTDIHAYIDARAIQDLPPDSPILPIILDYDQQRRLDVFNASVFSCSICFDEKKGSQCLAFKTCNHVFCCTCIRTYFEVQINCGNIQQLNCPQDKCSSPALPAQIRDLVSPELFAKYDRMLLSCTLDTMSDVVYCPRKMCQCAVLVEPDSNMGNCPACYFVFCILCKMAYHGVVPCRIKTGEFTELCEQYVKASEADKSFMEKRYGRKQLHSVVQNVLSEVWVQSNSKRCPRCNTPIEKLDGCNKMTCFRCNCYFCWLCMTRLNAADPYSHYSNESSKCQNLLFQGVDYESDEEEEFGAFLQ